MAAVLETHNLTKRFGKHTAVDGLTLTVEQGDLFGFLGPNGAGKSTTLRMALALVRPTAGGVLIFGRDVWRNKLSALRNVGALVETPSFYKFLTGRQNLMVLGKTGGGVTKTEVDKALDIAGLTERANDKVGAYSHGMRQRLGIAQALLGDPKLVVLDEPTTGLDPEGMKEIRELIQRLKAMGSVTVMLSSHLLHEVEQICNKVAIINRGRIVAQGLVSEMLDGRNAFEIRTSSAGAAAELIDRLEWASVDSLSEESITVNAPQDRGAELNRILVERGVDVNALIPKSYTLEDAYMSLTGTEQNADSHPA